jgi:hypothetical protein
MHTDAHTGTHRTNARTHDTTLHNTDKHATAYTHTHAYTRTHWNTPHKWTYAPHHTATQIKTSPRVTHTHVHTRTHTRHTVTHRTNARIYDPVQHNTNKHDTTQPIAAHTT